MSPARSNDRAASRGLWGRLRPHLRLWIRDGLLVCGLTIALTTLDQPTLTAMLWWSLPPAWLAIALTLAGPEGCRWRWRQTGVLLLFGAIFGSRAMLSLNGPLPAHGLREAMELAAIMTLAAALAMAGTADGRRAATLWIWALLVGLLAELGGMLLAANAAGFAPAPNEGAIGMMGLGAAAGVAILIASRERFLRPHLTRRVRRMGALSIRAASLAAGFAIAYRLSRLPADAALDVALPLAAGRAALQNLWLQSVLVGWGGHGLRPLADTMAEPHAIAFAPWAGPWALSARGGLIGVGILMLVCLVLLLQRTRSPRLGGADAESQPGGAASAALFMGGLILGGGPLSAVSLFCFAGWTALAWSLSPRRERDVKSEWSPSAIGASGIASIALTLVILLAAIPLRGDRLARRAMDPNLPLAQRERMLSRAEALNPFDPSIPYRLAGVLRERMSRTNGWSEALYLSVIDAYGRAQRLDPYETHYARTMANFQMLCERNDDAFATVHAALDRRPHAVDLCEWLFLTSLRLDRNQETYRALDRGARMEPMRPDWWLRQYDLANARGQNTLAGRSLSIAMTADLENFRVNREAWKHAAGTDAAPRPGVQFPRPDEAESAKF
jgi:hypothetical protein